VTIAGRLAGEYVQIAATCCEEAIASKKRVHVFLSCVSAVDEGGRNLLSRLVTSGCHLHASGAYNSYIVQTLQPVKDQQTNSIGEEAGKRR
jgi:hypothetical protein